MTGLDEIRLDSATVKVMLPLDATSAEQALSRLTSRALRAERFYQRIDEILDNELHSVRADRLGELAGRAW